MIQRLFTLVLLCCLPYLGHAADEAPQPAPKPMKSAEERYLEGASCLKQADSACAQVILAGLPPASPYTKILDAQVAALDKNDDKVLRLLIPLQGNTSLLPQAMASLHATLAQAYENQGNVLRAMEHWSQTSTDDPVQSEQRIWNLLQPQTHAALLELRGESQDTLTQGWIDLAIAAGAKSPAESLAQWRAAYPDHPASEALLAKLAQAVPTANAETSTFQGIVALLLPMEEPVYQAAAEAVYAGIQAARGNAGGEVRLYGTKGDKTEILSTYQQAVAEGAQFVVGPMAREEVVALATAGKPLIPTLALNQPEQDSLPDNLMTFGLPVEAEARQAARVARAYGIQSANVVSSGSPLAKRMEQAFIKEWQVQEGTLVGQKAFGTDTNLAEFKSEVNATPADMIFLAASVEEARMVRPYLDQAIPTFASSHVYDGVADNPENAPLSAIHFVDMPWMINPNHPDFAPYREAAAKLPPGQAQRWFAVGVDAWNIIVAKAAGKSLLLPGLSGTLHMEGNNMVRELPMAQFTSTGILLEPAR